MLQIMLHVSRSLTSVRRLSGSILRVEPETCLWTPWSSMQLAVSVLPWFHEGRLRSPSGHDRRSGSERQHTITIQIQALIVCWCCVFVTKRDRVIPSWIVRLYHRFPPRMTSYTMMSKGPQARLHLQDSRKAALGAELPTGASSDHQW